MNKVLESSHVILNSFVKSLVSDLGIKLENPEEFPQAVEEQDYLLETIESFLSNEKLKSILLQESDF